MSAFAFRGPLAPDDARFRGRSAELQHLRKLCEGDVRSYAIVYGGRQNGKTSLLLRLEASLSIGARACIVDFQALPGADTTGACAFLIDRVAETLGTVAPVVDDPASFISALARLIGALEGGRLVLLLEELGALPHATRHDLANVIRSCFTGRYTTYRAFAKLVIVLAGGIELYDLAATEVSTLHNICEEYYLSDLSAADAQALVAEGLTAGGISREVP
jgi:hypothetical protein